MIRVCIICEGATEVTFVNQCLAPYLLSKSVIVYPTQLSAPSGRHRGGRVTVERLVNAMCHHYGMADRVSCLVDFYGFQDRQGRTRAQLENDIRAAITVKKPGCDQRFVLPYVQMHEFEALLFTDIEQFEWVQDGWSEDARVKLQAVRAAYANPEDINNSPQTAPSKRLLAILGEENYSKVEHGPLVAEAIGLDEIRRQCPQFNQWLSALEAWGN